MNQSKRLTLKQLKVTVYKQYQVENSHQLKKISPLAAQSDLRYKKSWYMLEKNEPNNNVVSLAVHIAEKGHALNVLDTGLKSLESDLAAFKDKIKSDFTNKRKNSKKYRDSLTYL